MNKSIILRNVNKVFNGSLALNNLSFEIDEGKIVAILGSDGSGKTTLLRILIGLLKPSSGVVEILNLNPDKDKKEIVKYIGYMPQSFGLYNDLTVNENLNLFANLKNAKDNNFDEILKITSLDRFKDRLAGKLSGGMKQKLGLACAILGKPKVLIFDEPSVGVDPLSRIELLNLVKKLKSNDTTVIWSSSYLDEVYNFDSLIILDKGKIIFNGKTNEVGKDFSEFKDNIINLMGGYNEEESNVAVNYNLFENSEEYSVVAQNLSKRFGNFWAVKNNSFSIKKGEIFGLLGPNGAGKSTTFYMMCGLIKQTSGKRYILGNDIDKNPQDSRLHLGYMAQKFSLYDKLTTFDNIDFFAGLYGMKGIDKKRKIKNILELFDLYEYKNTIASLLPLGFKQRLSFACSLIHCPSVLFLDEPTSGVDIIERMVFWKHIKKLSSIGVSVLVTTHFMEEAEFCDKVSLFYDGKIIALGKPQELIKKANSKDMQGAFINLIKEAKINK